MTIDSETSNIIVVMFMCVAYLETALCVVILFIILSGSVKVSLFELFFYQE